MSRQWLSRLTIVALLVGIVVALQTLPVAEWIASLETWARAHPVGGPLAYVLVTIISVVALTPGWIPMTVGGLLFGFLPGSIYAVFAMTIGAVLAMHAGRTLARGWVESRIAGNDRMLALDDALEDRAFMIVVLTRIALVIPFNLLNYVYGLTRVRTGIFFTGTAVGMVPIVAIYAFLGSNARNIRDVFAGEARLDVNVAWIAGMAAVVIVIVIVVVRRAVLNALEKRTGRTAE